MLVGIWHRTGLPAAVLLTAVLSGSMSCSETTEADRTDSPCLPERASSAGGQVASGSHLAAARDVPRAPGGPERGKGIAASARGLEDAGGQTSVRITGLLVDESSRNSYANRSDLFPTTWAADGHLYTAGGDGDGWDGEDTRGEDVNRLERVGPDGDLSQGTELFSKTGVLPKGLISVGGTLWLAEQERGDSDGDGGAWEDIRIGMSTDHGCTWEYLDPAPGWTYENTDFMGLSFVQMGQAYRTWWDESRGGEGAYVYGISNDEFAESGDAEEIFLMRFDRNGDLRDPAYHEFFAGTDAGNVPSWSPDPADAVAMYTESRGDLHWGYRMAWNPVLNRFLLAGFTDADDGTLRVFEGPTPWGPWEQIHEGRLVDTGEKHTFLPVSKSGDPGVTDWLSADGRTWWAVVAGSGSWDSFNTLRFTLTTE